MITRSLRSRAPRRRRRTVHYVLELFPLPRSSRAMSSSTTTPSAAVATCRSTCSSGRCSSTGARRLRATIGAWPRSARSRSARSPEHGDRGLPGGAPAPAGEARQAGEQVDDIWKSSSRITALRARAGRPARDDRFRSSSPTGACTALLDRHGARAARSVCALLEHGERLMRRRIEAILTASTSSRT